MEIFINVKNYESVKKEKLAEKKFAVNRKIVRARAVPPGHPV